MTRARTAALLLLAASILASAPVAAQYPARTVRIVTVSLPGTAPDVLARAIAAHLTQGLRQSFVVETRPGTVGAAFAAKAAPDGHTLFMGTEGPFTSHPFLYKDLGYDPLRDFVPISSIMSQPFVLVVNPALPVKTAPEFIDLARRANPPLFYGSAGIGTASHLAMEMLKSRAGINLVHVPVKGGGSPLLTLVVSGEVVATIGGTSVHAQVRSGKLTAIATTGSQRSSQFPDLATLGDSVPGFELTTWLGLFAPSGTPAPVLAKLRGEMLAYLSLPETRQKFTAVGGVDPLVLRTEEFEAMIRREHEKYARIIRELGIAPQ